MIPKLSIPDINLLRYSFGFKAGTKMTMLNSRGHSGMFDSWFYSGTYTAGPLMKYSTGDGPWLLVAIEDSELHLAYYLLKNT